MTEEQKDMQEFFIQCYTDYCIKNNVIITKEKIHKEYNRFVQQINNMAFKYLQFPYFGGNNDSNQL